MHELSSRILYKHIKSTLRIKKINGIEYEYNRDDPDLTQLDISLIADK